MTDTEFDLELIEYLSDLLATESNVIQTEFYLNIQPGLVSFGGHFLLVNDEMIAIDIRKKRKSSSADFAVKVESYHKQSTAGGLNKWNKALFKVANNGDVSREFIWDEAWEQEERDSYSDSEVARQKWYWEDH